MNKSIWCSDLHFGIKGNDKQVFKTQLEFFHKQLFPYILQNNIKYVICLGDVFHSRDKIDVFILQMLKEQFFSWFETNKVEFHVLSGNHDVYHNSTLEVSILNTILRGHDYKYCFYYDEVTKVKIGPYIVGMIPWIIDKKNFKVPSGCDILALHAELKGFSMTRGIECKDGMELADFEKKAKLIFSGHFHLNRLPYIGTPYQLDWNDFQDKKGVYDLDDNFNPTFIENVVSPKHLKVMYSEKNGISVIGE